MVEHNSLSLLAEKVAARSTIMPNGCMVWQGSKNTSGYGMMRSGGRLIGVHRIMLAHKLSRPDLLAPVKDSGFSPVYALHSCDNPPCCNPDHLRLGNVTENTDDRTKRGRLPKVNLNLPRKLDADAVREIRRVAQTWEGMCDMMKKYRVGQQTVQGVANGSSHRHITD